MADQQQKQITDKQHFSDLVTEYVATEKEMETKTLKRNSLFKKISRFGGEQYNKNMELKKNAVIHKDEVTRLRLTNATLTNDLKNLQQELAAEKTKTSNYETMVNNLKMEVLNKNKGLEAKEQQLFQSTRAHAACKQQLDIQNAKKEEDETKIEHLNVEIININKELQAAKEKIIKFTAHKQKLQAFLQQM